MLCTFELQLACLCNNLTTLGPIYSKWFRKWLEMLGYPASKVEEGRELELIAPLEWDWEGGLTEDKIPMPTNIRPGGGNDY